FGATHTLDGTSPDLAAALAATAPPGLDYALDTTGLAPVVAAGVGALNTRGTLGVVGAGGSEEIVLDWRTVLNGRTVTGIIAGNSVPELFLPKLVAFHAAGRFPAGELIEYFPFEQIGRAMEASAAGEVVKPVLTFE
ncbi:MAG TPA: zinc-binding dehydrogenase, partial [Acidimicrobiales bacterium]|nr:zinc-binding dehydrogenase [Acidimicrobiales bacterium]